MNTTVFMIIMVLMSSDPTTPANNLVIPMPNMALCKALESEALQEKVEDIVFLTRCIDMSEEPGF